MDWISDGESFASFRQKLLNFNDMMRVTVTDATITAGAITSIPVADFPSKVVVSGDHIWLEDVSTFQMYECTLTADYTLGDNSISISSVTLPSDMLAGSVIYLSLHSIMAKINP